MKSYTKRLAEITERSQQMKNALMVPVVDDDTGEFITNSKLRSDRLSEVTGDSIFEMAGKQGPMIQATASNALRSYCTQRGVAPTDEMLASAHMAIDNALAITNGNSKEAGGMLFEAAAISTTEGILMRDRMVALILPTMLRAITADIVTHIPGTFGQSEIFKIHRIAGSTFGDLTKGDRIDYGYQGQYSSMDILKLAGTGDGTDTGSSDEFDWDSNTEIYSGDSVAANVWPMKKKSIRILHDRNVVAKDDGSGNIHGAFLVSGSTVTVTGTVDYDNGTIHPVFSAAPANAIQIHSMFDVNIEKAPSLIPLVDHEMESEVLYPHEAAIAGDVTLQALWAMRKEYNLNQENMSMTALRDILAADKDRKRLRDMYFFMKDERSWDMTIPTGLPLQDHYETIRQVLLTIDSVLMQRTGISGLKGLVADAKSCVVFRSLKAPFFTPAIGYNRVPQPHYVGKLFGMWDLYEDPYGTDYTSLAFARGARHGEAGYVAGDAVPALSFKHSMQRDLQYKNTLWELAYRDLSPFDGRDWFIKFSITAS